MKWTPKDVIAILVILVAAALLFTGIDDKVAWSLLTVVLAYYGINLTILRKRGNHEKEKKEE